MILLCMAPPWSSRLGASDRTHYLSIVASLMPRQLNVERTSPLGELSDEELQLLGEDLAASRAKLVQKLNGTAIALEPSDANQLGRCLPRSAWDPTKGNGLRCISGQRSPASYTSISLGRLGSERAHKVIPLNRTTTTR
jgi:hypothetical protein